MNARMSGSAEKDSELASLQVAWSRAPSLESAGDALLAIIVRANIARFHYFSGSLYDFIFRTRPQPADLPIFPHGLADFRRFLQRNSASDRSNCRRLLVDRNRGWACAL